MSENPPAKLKHEIHELCLQLTLRITEYDIRNPENTWPAAHARTLSGQAQKLIRLWQDMHRMD